MVHVNDFSGATDNEIIENAIKGKQEDGIVVLSPVFLTRNQNVTTGCWTGRS